jgi:hypothetical protein
LLLISGGDSLGEILWGTAQGADGATRKAGYCVADVEFSAVGIKQNNGLVCMIDEALYR